MFSFNTFLARLGIAYIKLPVCLNCLVSHARFLESCSDRNSNLHFVSPYPPIAPSSSKLVKIETSNKFQGSRGTLCSFGRLWFSLMSFKVKEDFLDEID